MKSSIRNEIKAQIIRAGYTMQEVVDQLHDDMVGATAYPIFREIAAGITAVS